MSSCRHPRTEIVPEGDVKVEVCRECGSQKAVHERTNDEPVCGYETKDGGVCSRTVNVEGKRCWQHGGA